MSYSYPDLPAQNPESSEAIPAREYTSWLVTKMVSNTDKVEETNGVVEARGTFVCHGRKMDRAAEVINPSGQQMVYSETDITELLNRSSVFADAYTGFVTVSAMLLEEEEAEQELQGDLGTVSVREFRHDLRKLRRSYRKLKDNIGKMKVTLCLEKYPSEWSQSNCLVFLGLLDTGVDRSKVDFEAFCQTHDGTEYESD